MLVNFVFILEKNFLSITLLIKTITMLGINFQKKSIDIDDIDDWKLAEKLQ